MSMTIHQLKAAVLELLELRSPEVMSAGEVTTALNAGGAGVGRPGVDRVLKNALAAGEVFGEKKLFERNGGTWPGTAYGRKPKRNGARADVEQEEPMLCPGCNENELQMPMVRNSLSRRDNATYICNPCGTAEAFADFGDDGDPFTGLVPELDPFLSNSNPGGDK